MKSRIHDDSYVIGLDEKRFLTDELRRILENEVDREIERIANNELPDWVLLFDFIYNEVENILIFRKNKSMTKEKRKEIVIHIPIPTKDVVSWGVNEDQFRKVKLGENILKNANILYIDPKKYSDGISYTTDVVRMSVHEIFRLGVTVNGKRIIKEKEEKGDAFI